MNAIDIAIREKIATKICDTVYICGNSDFIVRFDFDEEWNDYEAKTVRFVTQNNEHVDVPFVGNECAVPVFSDVHNFRVGVFAGNLHTTTSAYVPCKKSILCGTGDKPLVPEEDAYDQMMEAINADAVRAETAANASTAASNAALEVKGQAESHANISAASAAAAQAAAERATAAADSMPDIGIVRVSYSGGVYTSSHTFDEITQLVAEGKTLFAVDHFKTVYSYVTSDAVSPYDQTLAKHFAALYTNQIQSNPKMAGIWEKRLWICANGTVKLGTYSPAATPNPFALNITKGDEEIGYDGSEEVTVEIPKELPDGAEPHQMLVTDADGVAKWEERTHYVENGTVDYLPECEGIFVDEEMFAITKPFNHDFVFGETYTVYWNGVAYETVCKEFVEDEGNPPTPGLGDMDLLMGTGSTGEPFFIAVTPDGVEGNTEITAMLIALDGSTSVTLRIEGEGEVAHKIPDKFINFPESEIMIVECTPEKALDFTTLKPNKTFTQVEEAYNAGKYVIFRILGYMDVPVEYLMADVASGRVQSAVSVETYSMDRNQEYLIHESVRTDTAVGRVYFSIGRAGQIQTSLKFSDIQACYDSYRTVVCRFYDEREKIYCHLSLVSYNANAKTAVFGLATNERYIKVTFTASNNGYEYLPITPILYVSNEYLSGSESNITPPPYRDLELTTAMTQDETMAALKNRAIIACVEEGAEIGYFVPSAFMASDTAISMAVPNTNGTVMVIFNFS